jgi:peroxiredoxin
MNQLRVSPLETAFLRVRASNASLGERLQVIADVARELRPEYSRAIDSFAARLEAVRAGHGAPAVGDAMPLFTLPDQDGRLVLLDDLIKRGPVVVAFHRGHWCPFCRMAMTGLAEIQEKARPAQIVAISCELPRYTRRIRDEVGATFPFLSDMDARYTLSLKLAAWLDDTLTRIISEAGYDIPVYQGGGDWVLPIPSVFVIDGNGIITARHIDPDYRRRMELDSLLEEIARVC